MRKISYYLIFIVIIGGILVVFWISQKYFSKEEPDFLLFNVEKGSIQEAVKVRGKIVPKKEFDMEFSFSGIIDEIFVEQGQEVKKDSPLIRMETTDYELEIKKLQSQVAQAQSNKEGAQAQLQQYQAALDVQQAKLDELTRGTRQEEIQIAKTRVLNAQRAVKDAEINLKNIQDKADVDLSNAYLDVLDILHDAYTKADSVLHKQLDALFDNDNTDNPRLTFQSSYTQAKIDTESQRVIVGDKIKDFKQELDILSGSDFPALDSVLVNAENYLTITRAFLNRLNDVVNNAVGVSESTLSAYKSNVNTSRTNINTAISNVSNQKQVVAAQKITNRNNIASAEFIVNDFENALSLVQDELTLKQAGATNEQISAQEAQVEQAKANVASQRKQIKQFESSIAVIFAQIEIAKRKIQKSTLYAPMDSRVVQIFLEKQELFSPGKFAISLFASGYKIQADVSELEIGKIREVDGNDVLIKLDAFPALEFNGRVISIEPKEVVKQGDRYYRVNVYLQEDIENIRSGMSADLIINIFFKDNVLKVPEFTVYQKNNKKFVKVLEQDLQKETEIQTGISDGEYIEVTAGLEQGQVIVVSAD